MLQEPVEDLRLVTCHLGAGDSLTAVLGGRSVDTTMGFTPLEGLVMQTRSGSVDPGLLMWLLTSGDLSAKEALNEALEHHSGLAGLSGTGGDLRDVLDGREQGDAGCALAYDVFVHRLVREIGAMAASTGGLDALVFTGGIGEHAATLRAEAVERLAHLGLVLDRGANDDVEGDADLSVPDAAARVLVIEAAEDLEVAREAERLMKR